MALLLLWNSIARRILSQGTKNSWPCWKRCAAHPNLVGTYLYFLFKVADACLKVDGGDGGSTISGEQVGALADGEGRLVNGPHWIQRRSGLSTTFKTLKFASLVLLCFVQGVSQTSWP